jgi:hypothetical protein
MLEIKNIHKTYEGKPLLQGVSFTVLGGKPSACWGLPQRKKHPPAHYYGWKKRQGEVFWEV